MGTLKKLKCGQCETGELSLGIAIGNGGVLGMQEEEEDGNREETRG